MDPISDFLFYYSTTSSSESLMLLRAIPATRIRNWPTSPNSLHMQSLSPCQPTPIQWCRIGSCQEHLFVAYKQPNELYTSAGMKHLHVINSFRVSFRPTSIHIKHPASQSLYNGTVARLEYKNQEKNGYWNRIIMVKMFEMQLLPFFLGQSFHILNRCTRVPGVSALTWVPSVR